MNHFFYDNLNIYTAIKLVHKYYKTELKQKNNRTYKSIYAAMKTIETVAAPRMVWKIMPVEVYDCKLAVLDRKYTLDSSKCAQVLSRCDTAVVMAVTLGKQIDKTINKSNLRAHERTVLDEAASKVIEAVADMAQKHIGETCAKNKGMTYRYSPGYCDWPIEQQGLLCSLLPVELIGISLSSTYHMNPRKTITAVFGIGDAAELKDNGNTCSQCSLECSYRRHDNLLYAW